MTGTSIGRATDYLLNLFTNGFTGQDLYQRPLTVQSLPTINPNVIIGDARPAYSADAMVILGRQDDQSDPEVFATAQYQVMGRQRISEAYELPGHILVMMDGPDQKPARDACLALFDGVTKLVWADTTLGGVLEDGRIGVVSRFNFTQPDGPNGPWAAESGLSVAASLSFGLAIENAYIP